MENKNNIDLIVTDLDDTIWDWLGMWYNSFEPYLRQMSNLTNISVESLKLEFKKLHQKYRSPECSYAIDEIGIFNKAQRKIIEENGLVCELYKNKSKFLKMYSGINYLLLKLKNKGVKIVGFTESNYSVAKWKISALGLGGVFDHVYTTEFGELPEVFNIEYIDTGIRSTGTGFWCLPNTKKPDPNALLHIIKESYGKVENTIYIGDKLDRDVHMANLAGVTSVHAKYGNEIDSEAYELLKQVTHWSDEDVQREILAKKQTSGIKIVPDYTINSFSEILNLFDFG